jgi:hypothetical protein
MGMVLHLLYPAAVAKQPTRTDVPCHDWEALKRAAGDELAYEFDGHELHVWLGRPEPGDRCGCGARKWA